MNFKDYLASMPSIEHLQGLNVLDSRHQVVHHIPAQESKLGSLKLYYALAEQFSGSLNAKAAEQGLIWFAEHVEDAKQHVGKHPNIDLLLRIQKEQLVYQLQAIEKA